MEVGNSGGKFAGKFIMTQIKVFEIRPRGKRRCDGEIVVMEAKVAELS